LLVDTARDTEQWDDAETSRTYGKGAMFVFDVLLAQVALAA
jgi:hypothetical protein